MHKANRSRQSSTRLCNYAGPTALRLNGTPTPIKSCLHKISSSDEPLSPTKIKQRVSFGEVCVRIYEPALGDNPFVTSGAPITIGWKFNQCNGIHLDSYETSRGLIRPAKELRLSAYERLRILIDQANVSLRDIKDAELRARKEREVLVKTMSKRSQHIQKLEEITESALRRIKRATKLTSKKREENRLWEKAHKVALRKLKDEELNEDEKLAIITYPGHWYTKFLS